jgi:predicted nucleic acid-binding protein
MERAVVDTNVLSYKIKKNPIADLYITHLERTQIFISFQTLAELQVWGRDSDWGPRRWSELHAELEQVTVVYASTRTCDLYAAARVNAKRAGKPLLAADAWVAAIALELEIPLVTHDPNDFRGVTGLEVVTKR